jgi:uncharacterized repeat protein (TIGR01451 family)
LDSVAGLFSGSGRRASRPARSHRRSLRLEHLENRSLLSVSVPAVISGVAFYDPTGSGLTAGDTRLSGVTVKLFKDGGNGIFDGGAGGDDTLLGSTVTNSSGSYTFSNLSAGTYFVEQMPATGYVLPTGTSVATVTITNNDLQGTVGTVIDSFGTTSQTATAAYPSGTTGTSYDSATEAIGGGRDMFVQLTSAHGSVTLGADSTTPDALDFTTGPGAVGLGQVTWQGQATGAYATAPGLMRNPTGLNNLDLTGGGASTGIELTVGADHAASATLKVYTDATDWSTATVSITANDDGTATQQVYVPFSSFTSGAGSGATFSNVGAIQLQINGPAATEGQVGQIGAVGPKVYSENFANVAQTDLAILKAAAPSTAVAGDQLTYTLTATNNGPSNATGVTVSDTLPASVTFVSATPSQGTDSYSGGVLTVDLGNLADGATATTTVVVTVAPSATGTIPNTATITGNETDPNLSNNSSTVQTPVTAQTDLAILKAGSPNPVYAGNTLTYTLTTTNNGPSNATGVTVVDTLPAGVSYASSTTTQGSASAAAGVVTINLGSLATGATATSTILVNVASTTVGDITNTATVSGNQQDTNPANNTATATTLVIQPIHNVTNTQTDLAIVKKASPTSVYVGGTVTYTLAVTNWGSSDATGVTVTDALPSGLSFLSVSASQGNASYNPNTGVITAALQDMTDLSTATVTIIARDTLPAGSTIINTATVTGNEYDPNTNNNQSTVYTPVLLLSKKFFLAR